MKGDIMPERRITEFDLKPSVAIWENSKTEPNSMGSPYICKLAFTMNNVDDHGIDAAFRERMDTIMSDAFEQLLELEKKARK